MSNSADKSALDKRKTVIIYRLGSLGDTVVALPCFHLIARKFPNHRRILLSNIPVHAKAPSAAAVLGDSGLIHDYMQYPVGMRNAGDIFKLWWQIFRCRADALIYLSPARPGLAVERDHLFFRFAGTHRIYGLPPKDARTNSLDERTGMYEPEAQRLARTLSSLGDAALDDPASWDLMLTQPERDRARQLTLPLAGKPFLAVALASKIQSKDWGVENWCKLMPRLHAAYPNHGVIFVGAREDREQSDLAMSAWGSSALNLCGDLSPRESAAAISAASCFIGPDSGPMHLAAATGVPTVAIFSARNLPGVWFPYTPKREVLYHKVECFGCQLEVCVEKQKKCINSITVDEVLGAVERLLPQEKVTLQSSLK